MDSHFKEYLEGGRLRIVKGDATKYEDVKKLFEGGKKVDVVISSVGKFPPPAPYSSCHPSDVLRG